jgi:hypothetical protein
LHEKQPENDKTEKTLILGKKLNLESGANRKILPSVSNIFVSV